MVAVLSNFFKKIRLLVFRHLSEDAFFSLIGSLTIRFWSTVQHM